MPRGSLSLPKDDGEAIRLFAEHHIIQVRRSDKTGRILEVDHVEFGWMKPETFYRLQKLHDALPLITKVMEGGYRMKAQLWQSSIEVSVLGSGTTFPLGLGVFAAAIGLYTLDTIRGATADAALDIAALFLPFGELWYLWRGALVIPEIQEWLEDRKQAWLDAQQQAKEQGTRFIEELVGEDVLFPPEVFPGGGGPL